MSTLQILFQITSLHRNSPDLGGFQVTEDHYFVQYIQEFACSDFPCFLPFLDNLERVL